MLVSYEVAKRGWNDVREGEVCKIPGLGPVSPQGRRRSPRTLSSVGSSTTAKICVTCVGGPGTSRSRWPSRSSSASHPHLMGSPAWIAATASGPSSTISSLMWLSAPLLTTISTPGAGTATERRPSRTGWQGKLKPPNPDGQSASGDPTKCSICVIVLLAPLCCLGPDVPFVSGPWGNGEARRSSRTGSPPAQSAD